MSLNIVYTITDKLTGKFYIGSTGNYTARKKRHLRELANGKHHCKPLLDIYTNPDNLDFYYYAVESREEAYTLEDKMLLENKDNPLLLNIGLSARGGDTITRHPDYESIKQARTEDLRRYQSSLTPEESARVYGKPGKSNPMYGKTHTPEAIEKIRAVHLGKPSKNKGIPMSETHYAKFMEGIRQRNISGNKNPFYGKKHSEETRRKIAAKHKGRLGEPAKAVIIDGVEYRSHTAAAEALGLKRATLSHRVKSKNPLYKNYISK